MHKIQNTNQNNILFLQGPMGYFFKKIDNSFRMQGMKTFKIGLNAGDYFFSNKDNYTPYKGKQKDWKAFIHTYMTTHKITKIFIFGDCRFYQRTALEVATGLDIDTFVFEEGYIRPNFVTFEKSGVNAFSGIPRDMDFYKNVVLEELDESMIEDAQIKYYRRAWSATTYFIIKDLFWFRYPYYKHHIKHNFVTEAYFGVCNMYRKYKYMITEKNVLDTIIRDKKPYYFIPLQTYNDFQIKEHSTFASIEAFIKVTILSFAAHAPKDTYLLFKHHPMDRGRKEYSSYIMDLANELDVDKRMLITHDIHLPSSLKHALATITINSTVGISSLFHRRPTITLGNAFYDIEGITCKGMTLDSFWTNYTKPNRKLFLKFRHYLITKTQLNGSFYGKFPEKLNHFLK